MHISNFDFYKDMLRERSGLVLTADKSYLLDSRLTPVAKKWGYDTLDALTTALRAGSEKDLEKDVIEAMTTNETSFFRDGRPFEIFRDVVMPAIAEKRAGQNTLRIWCAASSSGQEPYSLAITIMENRHLIPGLQVDILATDISDDILEIARKAEYSQFEVQRGLPVQLLMKYFEQHDDRWRLKDDIRNMVRFQNFNLLDEMTMLGMFDIIFCRNVLIYFSDETKSAILGKMARRLPRDGYLFLGGAETVIGITEDFQPLANHRGLYILNGADTEAAHKSLDKAANIS